MLVGAEAVIKKQGNTVVKERVKKSYRLEEIDSSLRKFRTRTEANLIREARRAGVNVPNIIEESEYSIKMELIKGDKVRDIFDGNFEEISEKIGITVSLLHKNNIIHGDLTTSNMILKGDLYLIDFGLGYFSRKTEDKAMDLYLLKGSLESTHFSVLEKAWKIILKSYDFEKEQVIKTLSKIEMRGRYKKR
jgi:Kae1-associated kinase Bud32